MSALWNREASLPNETLRRSCVALHSLPSSAISLSSLLPVVDSGRGKLLAITSDKRSRLAPEVPTVSQTGVLKDFQTSIWTALFAPIGTPEPVLSKIETDIIEALKDPEVVTRLETVGAEVSGMPAAKLREHIQRETGELKKIATEANIHVD